MDRNRLKLKIVSNRPEILISKIKNRHYTVVSPGLSEYPLAPTELAAVYFIPVSTFSNIKLNSVGFSIIG
jgi:hypothetical protein